MPIAGPFYFLKGSQGNVSLPAMKNKKTNPAVYWSKRLGLDLTMPEANSMEPTYNHRGNEIDPEVVQNRILNLEKELDESHDVACPYCDEHLSIEAPFNVANVCPYCDSEFEYEPEVTGVKAEHFDWYSADRERLLSALSNNTGLDSYEVLESHKGHRGLTMVANVAGTFFGLWFALGFAFFSGLFLLMLPLTLFGDSEVPLILALIFSIIGFLTFKPSVKFGLEIVVDFFKPETLEKYTRTQYFDPARKYIAWIEVIRSPGMGRQGSRFVLSEAILSHDHTLAAYTVHYTVDGGDGGGGGS